MKRIKRQWYYSLLVAGMLICFMNSCIDDDDDDDDPVELKPITDLDGNVYHPVTICDQVWMVENLNVSKYRNGDTIPEVTDLTTWLNLTTGAYCYYNNDSTSYAATYGKLYNWYAVSDPRGLAPEGWHIPTEFEWTTLGNCLGADSIAGGPLKETGTSHWNSPNTGATNLSGFTALPGGYTNILLIFNDINSGGYWWGLKEDLPNVGWTQWLYHSSKHFSGYNSDPRNGNSIRCIKD